MKLTSAENTVLHAILSVAFASIVTSADTFAQMYTQHGFDIVQAILFFLPTLAGSFGVMRVAMWHAIQTNPATPQAEQDLLRQGVEGATTLAQGAHDRLDQWVSAFQQHTHPQQPVQAPQSAAVPPALRPTVLQPIPADTPPVAPVSVPNVAPVGTVPLTTIPAIPAVIPTNA